MTGSPGPLDIVFTQFLRPNGRQVSVWIERSAAVVDQAKALRARGYLFEIEELSDGTVSMTVERPDEDQPIAIELCPNGPAVPATVDRLIVAAFHRVQA